jgi:hypothetical protein
MCMISNGREPPPPRAQIKHDEDVRVLLLQRNISSQLIQFHSASQTRVLSIKPNFNYSKLKLFILLPSFVIQWILSRTFHFLFSWRSTGSFDHNHVLQNKLPQCIVLRSEPCLFISFLSRTKTLNQLSFKRCFHGFILNHVSHFKNEQETGTELKKLIQFK